MGMKKKAELPGIPAIPEVPAIPVKQAGKAVEHPGDDKVLTKKPYDRDRSIEVQAIMKSTLESPFLAQLTITKSEKESFELLERVFKKALELYEAAK